jgi:serine/threonine protein kinase
MDERIARDPTKGGSQPASLRGVLDQVKLIATGGMSQIFRARQPALERYIVVKKLKDELIANSETAERFRREAKALASVLHQNVAHVYDFVETPRESYLLMEYIEGIDLSQAIEKVGHLPAEVAAAVTLGLAKGLSYIHAHSMIHRDVKPSNVRLTTRGEVKLMDFGIVLELTSSTLTRPGMMVGSPSYLSPEQVLGDELTPRSDIFLLGICLYEMLTGTRPFKEEGQETIFQRIREAKYTPVRKMRRRIPAALDRMVRTCLQREPEKRYENAREVIQELEQFLGPAKSSRPEEVILTYFESEALLTPAFPVAGDALKESRRRRSWLSPMARGFGAVALLVGAFFVGYHVGRLRTLVWTMPSRVLFPLRSGTSTQPPARPPATHRGRKSGKSGSD